MKNLTILIIVNLLSIRDRFLSIMINSYFLIMIFIIDIIILQVSYQTRTLFIHIQRTKIDRYIK